MIQQVASHTPSAPEREGGGIQVTVACNGADHCKMHLNGHVPVRRDWLGFSQETPSAGAAKAGPPPPVSCLKHGHGVGVQRGGNCRHTTGEDWKVRKGSR